jgi:ubiquinone/menaquinone biosynthesis C-methylase UbiE
MRYPDNQDADSSNCNKTRRSIRFIIYNVDEYLFPPNFPDFNRSSNVGLNLAYYPNDKVQKITTIDVNPGMNKIAQNRIATSPISVDYQVLNGEKLPMADATFDTVVSTWTLCSIQQVESAISEIYRVLKPGGKFLFIEHGLSNEPKIQTWQHRLTPIQKIIADGCHLDREIKSLIAKQFANLTVQEFYAPNKPKIGAYFYQGIATK